MSRYSRSRQHQEAAPSFDQVVDGTMHYRVKGRGDANFAQGKVKMVAAATCRAGSPLSLHIKMLDLRI